MMREFRFMLRDRAVWVWLSLVFVFSAVAVVLGLNEVSHQRAEIAELSQLDQTEREVVLSQQSDWGSAAYYTFHLAYDPPSEFAFAAIGQRDVSPWKHRIRMLALEGQIYETDANNPDFALIGRFDFAFVATLIAPLLVILLLFDLRSGEHAAGRLRLIEATASSARALWLSRAGLRVAGLAIALCVPLLCGGLLAGVALQTLLVCVFAVGIYLLFWMGLTLLLTPADRTAAFNLTVMLGVWLLVCAVMPAALTQAIDKAIPLPDGGDIVMIQREAVNGAWDLPKDATYDPFMAAYPEWSDFRAWKSDAFEWKWYYAFQQVGDQQAAAQSDAYREGRQKRDQFAGWSSLISPATALQRQLEHLAHTDMAAAIEYEQRVRAFHAELRDWYYPRLFQNLAYDPVEPVKSLPEFNPAQGVAAGG